MKTTHLKPLCITFATLLLCACSASALMPIKWVADGSRADAYATQIAQGETRDLVVTLKNYGLAVALPDSATAAFYYQTNGMGSTYWEAPATVTSNGVVTATWSPALDAGAAIYSFVLGVDDGTTNLIYTAYGILRMRLSPGHIPNILPLPRQSLDFATLDILNAPWATPEDLAFGDSAISNYVDSISLALGTAISNVWPTMVVTNYTYRPSAVASTYGFTVQWWDAYLADQYLVVATDALYRVATVEEWEAIMDKGVYTRELTLLPADAFGASMFDKPLITFASPYVAGAFASPDSGIAGHRSFWPLGYTSGDTLLSMSMDGGDVVNPDVFSVTDTVVTGSTLGTAPTEYALKSDLAATQLILTDHIDSPEAHAALIAPLATTNWVNSLRGIHADIASNIVYHIVVSNGHWLIKEVQ